MLGNVSEWCVDGYAEYPNTENSFDPRGPSPDQATHLYAEAAISRPLILTVERHFVKRRPRNKPHFGFRVVMIPNLSDTSKSK